LQKEEFDKFQIKQLIGPYLAIELFEADKLGKPYNNDWDSKNLMALAKEPSDLD